MTMVVCTPRIYTQIYILLFEYGELYTCTQQHVHVKPYSSEAHMWFLRLLKHQLRLRWTIDNTDLT
jgi:hypothetical protein